jgi:hypothetical protein
MASRPKHWIVRALLREDFIMMRIGMVLVVAAAILGGPVRADQAMPDTEGGRYVFSKQASGFLRLDTQSGAVAS